MNCSSGKLSYSTRALAEDALIDLHIRRNFPEDQGPQNVYECDICGNWHLTSRAPSRNQRLQEMMDSGQLRLKQQAYKWGNRSQ